MRPDVAVSASRPVPRVSRSGGRTRRVCPCAKARRIGVWDRTPAIRNAAEVEVKNWRLFMVILQGLVGRAAMAIFSVAVGFDGTRDGNPGKCRSIAFPEKDTTGRRTIRKKLFAFAKL